MKKIVDSTLLSTGGALVMYGLFRIHPALPLVAFFFFVMNLIWTILYGNPEEKYKG